ncbi:hypothetical protein PsorP6_014224 [Peronosclerospora sorghi]|uniref:Uncharacterized protein n=1 Tax=Peronosclerospora sorghi TaxID=230839 RepID=A0ACC0VIG4_9STRA|nr:hypothetical protein PsorP6_014224 [Peronosclerospora sorghi]
MTTLRDQELLPLTAFVADAQPSTYLKLTMSRRVKDKAIAESKLVPFLVHLLSTQPSVAVDATTTASVRRVLYGRGSRRIVLVQFSSVEAAQTLRDLLHAQPCALLNGRPLYVEFALPRNEKEARDRFLRVHPVHRSRQDFMVPWNLDKRFVLPNQEEEPVATCANHTYERPSEHQEDTAKTDRTTDTSASTLQAHVVQRYCHVFKQGELERLVELAGNARVTTSYYDESNWAVVLERIR